MAEQKHYSFRDGLPVAPDVAAIQKQWPDLKIGDLIPYDDMEALLGVERATPRFHAVTAAWRKRERRDHGRVIECQRGHHFYVATADQITAGTHGVLKHCGKKLHKHRSKLGAIAPETPETAAIQAHQMRLLWHLEQQTKESRKGLLPPPAVPAAQAIPPKS